MRRHILEDLGIDERVVLKQILKNMVSGCRPDLFVSGQGSMIGFCEVGTEPSS
jgi:hypothetical protein